MKSKNGMINLLYKNEKNVKTLIISNENVQMINQKIKLILVKLYKNEKVRNEYGKFVI